MALEQERPPLLVGRQQELQQLIGALCHGDNVVIVGEPGIGKSTLLRRALQQGAPGKLFIGGALASVSWIPYLPLRRATHLRGLPFPVDPGHVADLIADEVGEGVLAIEDLHWADPATLAVLPLLAESVQLVFTVRTGQERSVEALHAAEGVAARRCDLGPLPRADARTLVRHIGGGLTAHGVGAILQRAAGNPLIIEELVAGGPRVESLRLALAARLHSLSVAARESMEMLAVAELPLPAERLMETTHLEHVGLVVVTDGNAEIRHNLLAETIVSALGEERRGDLQRRVASLVRPRRQRPRTPLPSFHAVFQDGRYGSATRLLGRHLGGCACRVKGEAPYRPLLLETGDSSSRHTGAREGPAISTRGYGGSLRHRHRRRSPPHTRGVDTSAVVGLTPREVEVLSLICAGYRDQGIADRLGMSIRTVQAHVASARRKLGVRTRYHAAGLFQGVTGERS